MLSSSICPAVTLQLSSYHSSLANYWTSWVKSGGTIVKIPKLQDFGYDYTWAK
jgi:hypothetical protein